MLVVTSIITASRIEIHYNDRSLFLPKELQTKTPLFLFYFFYIFLIFLWTRTPNLRLSSLFDVSANISTIPPLFRQQDLRTIPVRTGPIRTYGRTALSSKIKSKHRYYVSN